MLTAIYNADFNEEKIGRLGYIFLKMMEESSTKVGNHYQLPLPLKNESMIFPDNRHLAAKILHYLKKRLPRNPKFFRYYWKFSTRQKLYKKVNKGSN